MANNLIRSAIQHHARKLASAQHALRAKGTAKAETETYEEKEFLHMLGESPEIELQKPTLSTNYLKIESAGIEEWENSMSHCILLHLNHAFCA